MILRLVLTAIRFVHMLKTDCGNRQPPNALTLFEFSEANDLGYALVQGKSIEEVRGYVPLMIQSQVDAARVTFSDLKLSR